MPTATLARPAEVRSVVLSAVPWSTYTALLKAIGDRPVRLTYDRGTLEIMSPSPYHESYKHVLSRLLETLIEELRLPCKGGGSTTFRRADLDRGLEPDECYWLANEARVRGKKTLNLSVDPPPDLALEVEATRSALNRMGIYAALGVPEVWRLRGAAVTVHVLQPDGTYREVNRSPNFPTLPLAKLTEYVKRSRRQEETSLFRSFRQWVRRHLLPAAE